MFHISILTCVLFFLYGIFKEIDIFANVHTMLFLSLKT